MEYSVKDTFPCEKELTIKIGKDLIDSVKEEYYDELSKEITVPGFRRGKAPREVLEKQYGEKAKEEITRKLLSIALKKVSEAEKLKIIAYPRITDLKMDDNELRFKAEVELDPEFKLGNYKGIKAKKSSFEIKEQEITEMIEKIRETFASFIPVSRESRLNDYLIADYEIEITGKPKEERKDEWILLHEHDALGDFSQKLIGVKSGEERNFEIVISEKHPAEELRGKKAQFAVKIKDVKEKSLPELNDELAKMAGEYKDLESLKQAVREDIKRKKEQEQEALVEHEILAQLVDNTSFQISRGVVERQLEKLVHDAMERMSQRGYPKEEIEKQHDALRKDFKEEAEKQVRLAFILDRIAEAEKIQINAQDLKERFDRISKQYHVPMEKVEEHFRKEENLEGLIEQLINEKVFQFIKQHADISNA